MSSKPRKIELLAPAKDLVTAYEAILHGADAVYVGAARFGARSAAGFPLEDLRLLVPYAHVFGAKVYVALNTILYDEELNDAELLIWEIYKAGADALIIQDMGILEMNLPPIPLHASTQCDTTSVKEAQHLESLGFDQIVLARELNVQQIKQICSAIDTPIEAFVHGALCVSYSGRCYISQALTKRSANRGNCSQQCRLPYNLLDAEGQLIRSEQHLLSPKDLNRSELLVDLLDAGVTSFKIEGRLKGISYVKNVVAYYRQCLDHIFEEYPTAYCRASYGRTKVNFIPNLYKSFNRGFTDYQLKKHSPKEKQRIELINPYSPKSQGEFIAELKNVKHKTWQLTGSKDLDLNNGDGLCFLTPDGKSGGVRVNKSLGLGQLSLARPLDIPKGSKIYRNYDQNFEQSLLGATAQRFWPIRVRLKTLSWGLALSLAPLDLDRLEVSISTPLELEEAKRFDRERLLKELRKFGDTPFVAEEVFLDFQGKEWFIPLSILSDLRRKVSERLHQGLITFFSNREHISKKVKRQALPSPKRLDYTANISNRLSRLHYAKLGHKVEEDAFELKAVEHAALMTTKHCLRYEIGYCHLADHHKEMPYQEPLYLERDGQKVRLDFDCKNCQMLLYKAD